jgi:SAM-dependent methyltransferase
MRSCCRALTQTIFHTENQHETNDVNPSNDKIAHKDSRIEDRVTAWNDSAYVEKFAHKEAKDFFPSERHFLASLGPGISSVLDIGCSSGRFLELLHTNRLDVAYTGIDISERAIQSACALYPEATFHAGDALNLSLGGAYDLVNATGVFQHEPRFEGLLDRMIDWSSRYVLFDVKLAALDSHLVDIDKAHSTIGGNRVPFIILNTESFLEYLAKRDGLSGISIFGYETPLQPSPTNSTHSSRLAYF